MDARQEHVFPRLQRYGQRRGRGYQPIDLRWGISHEANREQSTLRTCRAQIARCQRVAPRPKVVALPRDRHGWRPLPDESLEAKFAPHA